MFRNLSLFIVLVFISGCSQISLNPKYDDVKSIEKIQKTNTQISLNAISVLEPKCDFGDFEACNDLGANYEFLKDYNNAFKSYVKSCDGGIERSCANLGMLYELGLGVAKNPKKAIEIYTMSCNKSGVISCYYLANAYRKGEIVKQDYKAAMNAYVNACKLEDVPSCANIGSMYEAGLGVPKDEMRAYNIYRVACFRGFDKACPHMKRLAIKLKVD